MAGYLDVILGKSAGYLSSVFSPDQMSDFMSRVDYISSIVDKGDVVREFTRTYVDFIARNYSDGYGLVDDDLMQFVRSERSVVKAVWGDAYKVLVGMEPESVQLMVTSPPYYNAREYSTWSDLSCYLSDMRNIVSECYRVLGNHRVFVFNVGDVFDNDNMKSKSTWGTRRIPLGAYFIRIFEEAGFTFVDDFIWDKGEVQSQRHKNGSTPYPFYQYPVNCYEHLFVFHKHRIDKTRYPCPVCGTLKVNGNAQSEPGVQSWECKNHDCFVRSAGNRGKRFSLKTIMAQGHQSSEDVIDSSLVKKWRRDVVRFGPVIKINSKGQNTLGHSAPFPDDIPTMAVSFFSYKGELVLDPFAGSFTVPIVATNLGRVGMGIELNKGQFRDAVLRNIVKKVRCTAQEIGEHDYV